MTLDLDALEKIAKAATPGPWYVSPDDNYTVRRDYGKCRSVAAVSSVDNAIGVRDSKDDAAHIAAFDPPTVLALIEAARELEQLKFECAGRKQSLPEPGECDWPMCGCDPKANKILDVMEEIYLSRTGQYWLDRFNVVSAELAVARAHLRQAVKALGTSRNVLERLHDLMNDGHPYSFDDVVVCRYAISAINAITSLTAALGDQPPAPASTEEGT